MALAAELVTTTDALPAWMTGRTVGRKETVAKIKTFLKRIETAKGSGCKYLVNKELVA
jgi:hypothetical protein